MSVERSEIAWKIAHFCRFCWIRRNQSYEKTQSTGNLDKGYDLLWLANILMYYANCKLKPKLTEIYITLSVGSQKLRCYKKNRNFLTFSWFLLQINLFEPITISKLSIIRNIFTRPLHLDDIIFKTENMRFLWQIETDQMRFLWQIVRACN